MGTATKVPVTRDMSGEELSADEALASLRRYGGWPLLRDSFIRFRYADGFSHSRALALQTVLAVIPLAIAFVGLSTTLHTENIGRVAELTIHRLAAGPSAEVVDDALQRSRRQGGRRRGGRPLVRRGVLGGQRDHGDVPDRARRQPDLRQRA